MIVTALCWGSKAGRHWDGIEDPWTDQQNYEHPACDTWGQTDHRKRYRVQQTVRAKPDVLRRIELNLSPCTKINSESISGAWKLKASTAKMARVEQREFLPTSSQGSGTYRKEEAGVMGDSQETVSSPQSRTMHMWAPWDHGCLYKTFTGSHGVLALRGRRRHGLSPLTTRLSESHTEMQRIGGSLWCKGLEAHYPNHTEGRPQAQEKLANRKLTWWYFWSWIVFLLFWVFGLSTLRVTLKCCSLSMETKCLWI